MTTDACMPHSSSRRQPALSGGGGVPAGMAFVLASVALTGCIRAQLVPPGGVERDGSITIEQGGIELTARVQPGVQHLPSRITPIRISVTNRSDAGVYVDLADLELALGDQPIAFHALPIEALPPPRTLGLGLDPASPYASSQGAAPSGGARGGGYFGLSPTNAYISGHWRDTTASSWIESTRFAGGFIDVGETRAGYVYFDTPPEGIDRVNLRIPVRMGSGSGPVELFEIPYEMTS